MHRWNFLVIVVVLLFSHPCFALFGNPEVKKAKKLWKQGKIIPALKLFEKTTSEGIENANSTLIKLATSLEDLSRFEQMCSNGNAEGCAVVGWALVKKNHAMAVQYMRKSCEYGDAFSCACIGFWHLSGWLRKDCKKAFFFLKKACDKNVGCACYLLSGLYKSGCGVKKDEKLAREYLKKACSLHNKTACKELRPVWRKVLGF